MKTLPHRKGFTLLELVILLAVTAVILAIAVPWMLHSREEARKNQCRDHLKQLGLALHNYHDTYKVFPYASTYGLKIPADGKPQTSLVTSSGHSWIALVLPFMNQNELYQKIDFHRPFDDPNGNAALFDGLVLPMLSCPSYGSANLGKPLQGASTFDNAEGIRWHQPVDYALCAGSICPGVVPVDAGSSKLTNTNTAPGASMFDPSNSGAYCDGSGTTYNSGYVAWTNAHTNPRQIAGMFTRGVTKNGIRDCVDGTSNVIMAGERIGELCSWGGAWSNNAGVAITNMSPNSANLHKTDKHEWGTEGTGVTGTIPFQRNGGYFSHHKGGLHVLLVDGTTQFASNSIDFTVWNNLGNRSDGSTLDNPCGGRRH